MTNTHDTPEQPRLAELVVNAERHQHLERILTFVQDIHYFIDPDMFNIPKKRLDELTWCFQHEDLEHSGLTVMVSWDDLFLLELIVSAGYEYSLRKSTGHRPDGVTNVGFEALLKWLGQCKDVLFRLPSQQKQTAE